MIKTDYAVKEASFTVTNADREYGDVKKAPLKMISHKGLLGNPSIRFTESEHKDIFEQALNGKSDFVFTRVFVHGRELSIYFKHRETEEELRAATWEFDGIEFEFEFTRENGEVYQYLVSASGKYDDAKEGRAMPQVKQIHGAEELCMKFFYSEQRGYFERITHRFL